MAYSKRLAKPELAVGHVPKGSRRGAIEKATYRLTDMEWGDGPEALAKKQLMPESRC